MTRVNLATQDPASFDALGALNSTIDAAASRAGLDLLTLELLKVRVSQINGCASCLRLHTREAVKLGESAVRLALVATWRECQYFSPVEQAAFTVAESVTRISDGPMSDERYGALATVLTEDQYSALAWAAISINAWNRVALTSKWPVAPEAQD
jgi:AhpD family alkylhydroperoxidase